MRIGTVIGRVTLSKTVEELRGARWLIVSPFTRENFQKAGNAPLVTKEPSVVVYDDLGGGVGQTIGFIVGGRYFFLAIEKLNESHYQRQGSSRVAAKRRRRKITAGRRHSDAVGARLVARI